MSAKIAKRIRAILKAQGVNVRHAVYENVHGTNVLADSGRKAYKEFKNLVRKGGINE